MNKPITFLPVYDHSVDQNREYLRQCLPLMSQNNIPTNPINYAIWYEYVSGGNPLLVQEVDEILNKKQGFDPEIAMQLYSKYVCNASIDIFENINQKINDILSKTTNTVQGSSDKAIEAGIKFAESSEALANSESSTDISKILSVIISETKQLAEVSQNLKSQLDETNKEMQSLRSELSHVREVAKIDALTGLLNRRSFDAEISELFMHKQRHMSLAILDLDHFKRINDNFGHQIGDKVLKYFASLLIAQTANEHFVARYGGEEMAIIMPKTPIDEAIDLMEKIRKYLESSVLKRKDNTESIGRVTVSIGVAELNQVDTIDSLIERADQALYRAKEAGRNRVCS